VKRIGEFINDLQAEKKSLVAERNKLAVDLRGAKSGFAEVRRKMAAEEEGVDWRTVEDSRKELTRIQNQYDKAGRQIERIDKKIAGYQSRRDDLDRRQYGEHAVTRDVAEEGGAAGGRVGALIQQAENSDDPAAVIRGGLGGFSEEELESVDKYLQAKGIRL